MSNQPQHRSRRLRSILDDVQQSTAKAQQDALRAEDVLTALEDREARRAVRDSTLNPRTTIA